MQEQGCLTNPAGLVAGTIRNQDTVVSGAAPIPATISVNSARTITIHQQSYGYLVTVGCQTFCIEKKETLLVYLGQYLADPWGTEEKHQKGELFK